MHHKILIHCYFGYVILFQADDAFVNATAMCEELGKRLSDFLRLPGTKALQAAISEELNVLSSTLVTVRRGGNLSPAERGTWLHPTLAIKCAQWLNHDFSVWCSEVITRILSGDLEFVPHAPRNYWDALLTLADEKEARELLSLQNKKLKIINSFLSAAVNWRSIARIDGEIDLNTAAELIETGLGRQGLLDWLHAEGKPYQNFKNIKAII